MTELRATGPDDWQQLRDIRLDALREAPYALASTYDREVAYPDQTWRERSAAGERQPLPSDPALMELAMARTVDLGGQG